MSDQRSIIFRADADKITGFGHFIRSLALADYLKKDFNCNFCSFNSQDKHLSDLQISEIEKVCSIKPIKGENRDTYNINFLKSLTGEEIVVLDNYFFSSEYQKEIINRGCKLVNVDDVPDKHFYSHLLITPSPLKKSDFSLETYTEFLGGPRYSLLRKPFLENKRERASKLSRVVLAIGGGDPFNLTEVFINLLLQINPNIEIDVIAGESVIEAAALPKRVKIHRKLNAESITNIFNNADLGIFPTSTICLEAMAAQLPVAAGWFVDNQRAGYEYFKSKNWIYPLGNFFEKEQLKRNLSIILTTENNGSLPKIDFYRGKQEIIDAFKKL